MHETYLEPSNGNGIINAADVAHGYGTYTPPMFTGMLEHVKVVTEGIAGANYMQACVWRA